MLCKPKKCSNKQYKILVKQRIIGSSNYNVLDSEEYHEELATIYASIKSVNPYKFYNGTATTTPYTHTITTQFNEILTQQNLKFFVPALNLTMNSVNFKYDEFTIELYCIAEEKINGSSN